MGTVQFHNSIVLFGDSAGDNTDKIAMHEDCCCTEACNLCLNNIAPTRFQAAIAGVLNGTCGDCDTYNDTFIVDFVSSIPNQCDWRYNFAEVCGDTYIELVIYVVGATTWIRVNFQPTTSLYWAKSFVNPDCMNFNNEELTISAGSPECDPTAIGTCHITSL